MSEARPRSPPPSGAPPPYDWTQHSSPPPPPPEAVPGQQQAGTPTRRASIQVERFLATPPMDELPIEARIDLRRGDLQSQLDAARAASKAAEVQAGATVAQIKEGFSTYRVLLRRRRRRLKREASLLEESKAEELVDKVDDLERQILMAQGVAPPAPAPAPEEPPAAAPAAAEPADSGGGGAGGGGLTEDQIFDIVDAMDFAECVKACEGEGVDTFGGLKDLDDMKAELIELFVGRIEAGGADPAPSAAAASAGGPEGGAAVPVLDEEAQEWLEAVEEMDEDEAVQVCKEEGVEWEGLGGLPQIKHALLKHFCGVEAAAHFASGGAGTGATAAATAAAAAGSGGGEAISATGAGDTSTDNMYAVLIDEMDEETALAACQDEGLDCDASSSLPAMQDMLRAHFGVGSAGGTGAGAAAAPSGVAFEVGVGQQFGAYLLQRLSHVTPVRAMPLSYDSEPERREALSSFGNLDTYHADSAAAVLRAAAASGNVMLLSQALSVLSAALAPGQQLRRTGTVRPPVLMPEDAEGVMSVLRPYRTGGPLPPPGLVPHALNGLLAMARSGGVELRAALGAAGAVETCADWLGQLSVDAVTVAGCKVLAALCLELDNTRRFLSPTTDGMASLLQLLTDTAKIRCFSAAADVLVNIVAHQPQDPSIAAQVVQGDGSLASSDSSAAPLTDSLGAIFLSMHIASVEQRGSDAADFHVQVCKMLFFLCEDEGNRSLCTQARYLGALDELFAQHVADHQTSAVEHIGAVWAQLAQGEEGARAIAHHLAGGPGNGRLGALYDAFMEFPRELTVQRVLICVVAGLGVSSAIKMKVAQAGMLDCVVNTMRRFSDHAELQEQACRAVNAISKGEERIKEYLADRATGKEDGLAVVESIIEALDNFKDDEGVVLAGCSAVWSVAFKNVRMKNRAGELGCFPSLIELIRTHQLARAILPHAFVAIGNLCANHAPNQAICGQEGVVELCLELLPVHGSDATIVYTIFSCLSSVLAGQSDNVAKFLEAGPAGQDSLKRVARMHSDQQVQRCAAAVLNAVDYDKAQKASRQKERQRRRGSIIASGPGQLELDETAREPMASLSIAAKAEVLIQGKCVVKYKRGKPLQPKGVFLLRHELKFFADSTKEFKKAEEVISLGLVLSVTVAAAGSGPGSGPGIEPSRLGLVIETRLPAHRRLWLYPPSPQATKQWHGMLSAMLPIRAGVVTLSDNLGREKLERLMVYQGDPHLQKGQQHGAPRRVRGGGALFVYGANHFKLKRCYNARRLEVTAGSSSALGPWFEVADGTGTQRKAFKYLTTDAAGGEFNNSAEAWTQFLQQAQAGLEQEHAAEAAAEAQAVVAAAAAEAGEAAEREAAAQAQAERAATLEAKRRLLEAEDAQLDEEEAAEEAARVRAKEEEAERLAAEEAEKKRLKGKTPQELFDEVDADGSGAIDVEEMGVLLRKLGRQMTDAEVEAAFEEVDDDCSGEIEFFEFEYWWAGQQKAGVEQMTLDVQKADAHAAQLRADNVAKREKLEEAERVLAETLKNLSSMTDELSELLRDNGTSLAKACPDLAASAASGGRQSDRFVTAESSWQRQSAEAQASRDDIVSRTIGAGLTARRAAINGNEPEPGGACDDSEWD